MEIIVWDNNTVVLKKWFEIKGVGFYAHRVFSKDYYGKRQFVRRKNSHIATNF